jgi:hypothetical protein
MSGDIKTIKITDSRINDLTNDMTFGVFDGGSQSTYQQFPFNSASNSSLTANIQIPSESIVSDARVLFKSDLNLTVQCGNVPATKQAFQYGLTDSLNSYPLQSCFTTANVLINNANSSTNYQDVLPFLKLLEDSKNSDKINSTSPDYVNEFWGMYSDAILTNSNPMASYNEASYDNARIPNGAYPCTITVNHYVAGVLTDSSLISTATTDTWTIYLTFKGLTEPFLGLSPFANKDFNKAGLLGLNNTALTLNIDSAVRRVFCTGNTAVNQAGNGLTSYITNISLGNPSSNGLGFTNSKLMFNFLTLSDLQYSKISTRAVTNYSSYDRYISPASSSPSVAPNGTGSVTFQNIQLNQIPNLLVFALRVPVSQQNWAYTDSFLKINTVSITLNNQSGLIASGLIENLYNMSVDSGSHQSFYAFGGRANAIQNGVAVQVPTIGSMICINPSKFLSLNPLLSNSSIGQFNLQITITSFENQFPFTIQPEGIIMCLNSGYFITETGSSSIFTAVLDRQMVLDAKNQEHHDVIDEELYKRTVGGKMHHGFSGIAKFFRHMKPHHMIKKALGMDHHDDHEEGGRHRKHSHSMSKSRLSKLLR